MLTPCQCIEGTGHFITKLHILWHLLFANIYGGVLTFILEFLEATLTFSTGKYVNNRFLISAKNITMPLHAFNQVKKKKKLIAVENWPFIWWQKLMLTVTLTP